MAFIILAGFMLVPALYQILALALKVPSFKMSGYIGDHKKLFETKVDPLSFLTTFSVSLARFVPLSMAKEVKLENMLNRAGTTETPKEYTARLILIFAFIAVFSLPFFFISKILAVIILAAAALSTYAVSSKTKEKSLQLQKLIEAEIPRMVESITQKLENQRNVIAVFDSYIHNYDTYLSHELAKTVEDMRTGSPETALQRFELRMNNPILSQFVRGILATMRGENMTIYFNELIAKVSAMRRQRLTAGAQKVKPKISRLSMVRAFWSIGVLIAIAAVGMMSVNMI